MNPLAFPLSERAIELAGSRPIRTPVWRISIEGRDVTREISPMVLAVTYTDRTEGESDELLIQLQDAKGRWRSSWFPGEGDRVELLIGYQGEPLLPCGQFAIDELEAEGPPDTMTIRALATGPIPAYRTVRSIAYEGQTLREIAEAVAQRYSLEVVGTIQELRIERVTQSQERDLSFLRRIAERFGYVFSVRGDQMVFYDVAELAAAPGTWIIERTQITRYRLKKATHEVYKSAEVSYHSPGTKELLKAEVEAEGVKTGDVYRMVSRVESEGQAETEARAMLRRLNRKRTQGSVSFSGNPQVVAGSNGSLTGFGEYDGTYQVPKSTHRLTREQGYETTIELEGLG